LIRKQQEQPQPQQQQQQQQQQKNNSNNINKKVCGPSSPLFQLVLFKVLE